MRRRGSDVFLPEMTGSKKHGSAEDDTDSGNATGSGKGESQSDILHSRIILLVLSWLPTDRGVVRGMHNPLPDNCRINGGFRGGGPEVGGGSAFLQTAFQSPRPHAKSEKAISLLWQERGAFVPHERDGHSENFPKRSIPSFKIIKLPQQVQFLTQEFRRWNCYYYVNYICNKCNISIPGASIVLCSINHIFYYLIALWHWDKYINIFFLIIFALVTYDVRTTFNHDILVSFTLKNFTIPDINLTFNISP